MEERLDFYHLPVMLPEVLKVLSPHSGGLYIDGTMGGAGHSRAILESSAPNGRLIALDRDDDAISAGSAILAPFGSRAQVIKANFADMAKAVKEVAQIDEGADGILLDIGVSSFQLDESTRGFSYMQDAPLDMRMDQNQKLSAYEIINKYSEEKLAEIFYSYGEENWSKRIAKFIVETRKTSPIKTTGELVDTIKKAIPAGAREKDQHPAKRTFQALRIAVNDELGALKKGIDSAFSLLKPGGRLAIITFHSLEDRIVKEEFRLLSTKCICPPHMPICVCKHEAEGKLLSKKPILPQQEEIDINPRARSAKLRAIEKF